MPCRSPNASISARGVELPPISSIFSAGKLYGVPAAVALSISSSRPRKIVGTPAHTVTLSSPMNRATVFGSVKVLMYTCFAPVMVQVYG